jgi:hypothetical protein
MPQPSTSDPEAYLDDRSTALQVIRSYYNAINRREYARAYSYWEPAAAEAQLPPFAEFAHGYADTERVELVLGAVQSDVGAGQLYYAVPVALWATTAGETTQRYFGCYTLHLARPQIQAVPPFRPMGIRSATVWAWDEDADLDAALAGACPF